MLWETKTGSPVHYTEASERRDYDDRSIETSAKGGVRLGSAGRRATHSPPPSQISKVAAASTIPVTNAVAQANTRKSFRIPVIAAAAYTARLSVLPPNRLQNA